MSPRWMLRSLGRQLRRRRAAVLALAGAFALSAGLGTAALALGRAVAATAERLAGEVDLVVYLEPGLDSDRERAFAEVVARLEGVRAVQLIDGDAALVRLQRALAAFGDDPAALGQVESDLLPRSLEIALVPGSDLPERASALSERLRRVEGVAAIDSMTEGLGRIALWLRFARLSAIALGVVAGLAALGALLIVITRERARRREEVEALSLLGATGAFLRGPFALLGALAAVFGGLLGGVAGDRAVAAVVLRTVGTPVGRLAVSQVGVLLAACALVGLVAGWVSLNRFQNAR